MLPEIYKYLTNVIETMIKPPSDNNQLQKIYKNNEDLILNLMEDLGNISDEQQLTFTLKFIDSQSIPHIIVIIMLLQLNKFHRKNLKEKSNSAANVISSNIVEIVSKLLPILPVIKSDEMKFEICNLLSQVLETFIANQENTESYQNAFAVLSQIMNTIYEVVYGAWINSKDTKLKVLSYKLMGIVIELLPIKKVMDIQEKVVQLYIDAIKKENDNLRILEGLNRALERFIAVNQRAVHGLVKSILVSLHPVFAKPIVSPNSLMAHTNIKYRNEILKTVQIFGAHFASDTFEYYLGRLDTKKTEEIIPTLWILRHLIARFHASIGDHLKKLFYSQLKTHSDTQDYETRFVILEIILALVTNDLLKREEDQKFFLEFLLKQVATHQQEIADSKNAKSEGYETTLEIVVQRSHQIFHSIANEKASITFIWPQILGYVMLPTYSPGLATILKTTCTFLSKNPDELDNFTRAYQSSKTLPKPDTLLLRFLLLCYLPFIFKDLGYEVLGAIPALFKILDKDVSIPKTNELQAFLKTGKLRDSAVYYDKLENFIAAIINKFPTQDWYVRFNQAIMESYNQYQSNIEFTCALCRMHGMVLSKIERLETIRSGLEKLFQVAHPEFAKCVINGNNAPQATNEEFRLNVTKGLGLAAIHNFEAVLDFLKEVYAAEVIPKKQGGFTSFFSSGGGDALKENVKITAIQTLGFISYYGNPSTFIKKFEGSILPMIWSNLEVAKSIPMKLACYKSMSEICKALFRLYESDETLPEDFKLYVVKQREKILQRTIDALAAESDDRIGYYLYLIQAYISRVDPSLGEEYYFELLKQLLNLIPLNMEVKAEQYLDPLGETIYTIIYRNDIKSIQDGTVNILSFWEVFYKIIILLNKFLIEVENPEYKIQMKRKFLDMILKALNTKKITPPKPEDINFFLKDIIEVLGYMSCSDSDVQSNASLCMSKLLLAIECYLPPSNDRTESFKIILEAIKSKIEAKDVVSLLTSNLVSSLSNSKMLIF